VVGAGGEAADADVEDGELVGDLHHADQATDVVEDGFGVCFEDTHCGAFGDALVSMDRWKGSQQNYLLSDVPLPRRIASRPVDCMALTMADGAVVPSTATSWDCKSADTFVMPVDWLDMLHIDLVGVTAPSNLYSEVDTSLMHDSQERGTANVVYQQGQHSAGIEAVLGP
jgi:hypothetical protein